MWLRNLLLSARSLQLMEYQPVVVQRAARPAPAKHSAESRYWRSYKHPVFVKQYAPVTSINFAPSKPYNYAVTTASRVQIYAPRTNALSKTISRFKDTARSAHIRGDGRLLVAADDSGLVQIFDLNSRAILRTLDGHKQPVHVARFSALDPTNVLTCSDDATVRIWDVPSQTATSLFTEHTDYVRAGTFLPTDSRLVLSGSYDGTLRLFDSRTGAAEMTMRPPRATRVTPVEAVLAFPAGTAALSSAGNILRLWDLAAGGRCLRALSNHQKTVTALAQDASASRVLSAGLDHMVKVYDVATFDVVHTMRYPAPVLALALSPDGTHIAAGMSDGTLSVRRRAPKAQEAAREASQPFSAAALRAGAYESVLGTDVSHIGEMNLRGKIVSKPVGDANEFRVESKRRRRLKEYDRFLKGFKYSAALDSVLQKVCCCSSLSGLPILTSLSYRRCPRQRPLPSYRSLSTAMAFAQRSPRAMTFCSSPYFASYSSMSRTRVSATWFATSLPSCSTCTRPCSASLPLSTLSLSAYERRSTQS